MRLRLAFTALPFAFLACIDSEAPPDPAPQVKVPYGSRIYLKDATIETSPNRCRLLGAVVSTGSTSTGATTVGGDLVEDDAFAYNCYVEVTPGEITVDAVETTNELFQLCVDSGVCKKPDPAEVDKVPVCSDEESFNRCPVVAVRQIEAARFCEFVGRRLPTGIEAIAMRQGNMPQAPEGVQAFPAGNNPPAGCTDAVLKTCGKPVAITVGENGSVTGAAARDKTAQGVFDLTGNAAEWSSDLTSSLRIGAENLPWFCAAPLPDPMSPACPSGEACIMGTYRHPTTRIVGTLPVCIAERDLAFENGSVGSAFGGSYATQTPEPSRAGTFVRTERALPNGDTNNGDVGIRCVDVAGMPGPGIQPVLAP